MRLLVITEVQYNTMYSDKCIHVTFLCSMLSDYVHMSSMFSGWFNLDSVWVFVSVGAKLSFVEPGRRCAHSPSPSKAPGISTGYYENLREDVIKLRRFLTVIWYFCLFMLSTLHLALGILRCPTR